jgi:uncharacterized membrane protein
MLNANEVLKERLSKLDKLAIYITDRVGTIGFFLLVMIWTAAWVAWNLYSPRKFDPAPAFVILLLLSNFIQLGLMPLIMVGQNLQGRHAEIRGEADYEVNLKAEKEINEIQAKLDKILTHLNVARGPETKE